MFRVSAVVGAGQHGYIQLPCLQLLQAESAAPQAAQVQFQHHIEQLQADILILPAKPRQPQLPGQVAIGVLQLQRHKPLQSLQQPATARIGERQQQQDEHAQQQRPEKQACQQADQNSAPMFTTRRHWPLFSLTPLASSTLTAPTGEM